MFSVCRLSQLRNMEFRHLKCRTCEKYFCCVSHRIDHENKNHNKPILPKQENSATTGILPQAQKSSKIIYKTKNVIKTNSLSNQLKYKSLVGNRVSVVESSVVYLHNISKNKKVIMTEIVERTLESDTIGLTADRHSSEMQVNYETNIDQNKVNSDCDVQVNDSAKGLFGNKRRILLPMRRRTMSPSTATIESDSKTEDGSPIISSDENNYIKTSTPVLKDSIQSANNIKCENLESRNQLEKHSSIVSECSPVYYISPLTENNSLKASTPSVSHYSVTSMYQTPFGKYSDNPLEQSKVTPLRGIMSKSIKCETYKSYSPSSNEYSRLRKVTFCESASNSSTPLEPVKEVHCENDSILLDTEELGSTVSYEVKNSKGLLTTVAGIMSSAFQGLKSSWRWGHKMSSQKRLLTPDKQLYPVPKRLRYSNRQLLQSPVRGRRPIRADSP